jgi:hypothetical protein
MFKYYVQRKECCHTRCSALHSIFDCVDVAYTYCITRMGDVFRWGVDIGWHFIRSPVAIRNDASALASCW